MADSSLNQSIPAIKLYRFVVSGHAHRVELFLSLLGLPADIIDVDITKGERVENLPGFIPMQKQLLMG